MIYHNMPKKPFLNQPLQSSPSDSFIGRRKVIGSLGLAASAICVSSNSASAFFGRKKDDLPIVKVSPAPGDPARNNQRGAPSPQVGGLPQEWVKLQGGNLNQYVNYINSLKLRKISAQQVVSAHAKERGNVWNSLPPKQWWNRMGYTLRVLDRIALEMDLPCEAIVSAYRSPQYNARCAGAKRGSWHQANVALDVKFPTQSSRVAATARNLRDRGLFKGGVGRYGSFTHIDTRGTNVNW